MALASVGNPTIFNVPGMTVRDYTYQALTFGRQLRDEWMWEFPLLPGAIYTYQQMASGREWRVSGPPTQVSRAVEWINSAVCYNDDGTIERGWHPFESRRVIDYLCVGRTMCAFRDELEYLDPTFWRYDMDSNIWENTTNDLKFKPEEIAVHHPLPLGGGGYFRAPLASLLSTAMLAWLIREHDRAAADGRKIRDITLVIGQDLATQIGEAMKTSLGLWSGANPAATGVPLVWVAPNQLNPNMKAEDYVAHIGLANIPNNFNREGFQFEYVNEIAGLTGLALRHIWNSEKATNRALEEVQEARQSVKGPSSFSRNEQSIFRDYKILKKFGPKTRMSVIEEVDVQSRKTNAEILKLYADSLPQFAAAFGAELNAAAFLGWLQREGQLPADIDLITDAGTIENLNELETPDGKKSRIASNEESAKSLHLEPDLDYDEVTMDMQGKILSRRPRIYTIEKAILAEKDKISEIEKIVESEKPDYLSALRAARISNREKFFNKYPDADCLKEVTTVDSEFVKTLYDNRGSLTDDQDRFISSLVRDNSLWEKK